MSSQFHIEIHRRVYDNDHGHYLTVKPSADFPEGSIVLMSEESEQDYYGALHLDLPAKFMRKIAEALLAACDEMGD